MPKIIHTLKAYWQNSKAVRKLYHNPLKKTGDVAVKDDLERQFYDAEALPWLKSFDPARFLYDEDEDMPLSHQHFYSLLAHLSGKRVLDICCGYGITSVRCAKKGAQVTAIDISANMLAVAQKNVELNGAADRVDLRSMSAHAMEFPDDSFDYIVGVGALHHLNLDTAGREISRVLKKGGSAIFLEPRTPFKWLFFVRSLFPQKCLESPGGGGLTDREIAAFAGHLDSYQVDYFMFLRKLSRLPFLARFADRFDRYDRRLVTAIPLLRRLCWAVVLRFYK
jgi:ubiquinone/menaquinone biosynthesis C-methylase UbiE